VSPALTPSRGSTPAGNGWILHLQRATNKFCRKPELGDKISSKVDQSRNMGAALTNPQGMWAAAVSPGLIWDGATWQDSAKGCF